ncbi:hypothetical protein [Rahnella sp. PCH160]|uniref:hypothetical protein n=1 Tax=Rahnella sp. PCH160 TaxID=3447928 RepID=UPI0039FC65ED
MNSYDVKNLAQNELNKIVKDSINSKGKTVPYDITDENTGDVYTVNVKNLNGKDDRYIIIAITNKADVLDQIIYADDNKNFFTIL